MVKYDASGIEICLNDTVPNCAAKKLRELLMALRFSLISPHPIHLKYVSVFESLWIVKLCCFTFIHQNFYYLQSRLSQSYPQHHIEQPLRRESSWTRAEARKALSWLFLLLAQPQKVPAVDRGTLWLADVVTNRARLATAHVVVGTCGTLQGTIYPWWRYPSFSRVALASSTSALTTALRFWYKRITTIFDTNV